MSRLLWWLSDAKSRLYLAAGIFFSAGVVAVSLAEIGMAETIPITVQSGIGIAVVIYAIGVVGERIKVENSSTNRQQ